MQDGSDSGFFFLNSDLVFAASCLGSEQKSPYVPEPGMLTLAGPCVVLLPKRCVLGSAKANPNWRCKEGKSVFWVCGCVWETDCMVLFVHALKWAKCHTYRALQMQSYYLNLFTFFCSMHAYILLGFCAKDQHNIVHNYGTEWKCCMVFRFSCHKYFVTSKILKKGIFQLTAFLTPLKKTISTT